MIKNIFKAAVVAALALGIGNTAFAAQAMGTSAKVEVRCST